MLESSLQDNQGGQSSRSNQGEQQVPYADKVLQDRKEVRLGRGVHYQVLHQLKALVDIVQLQSDIVKPGDQVVNATLVY